MQKLKNLKFKFSVEIPKLNENTGGLNQHDLQIKKLEESNGFIIHQP